MDKYRPSRVSPESSRNIENAKIEIQQNNILGLKFFGFLVMTVVAVSVYIKLNPHPASENKDTNGKVEEVKTGVENKEKPKIVEPFPSHLESEKKE